MACGWILWIWLPCIGVVSGCCLRRYIDILTIIIIINFPYSTCISSFFSSSIPTSLFIFKMFFRSCFCNCFTNIIIANVTQRTFEIVQKNRVPANIII